MIRWWRKDHHFNILPDQINETIRKGSSLQHLNQPLEDFTRSKMVVRWVTIGRRFFSQWQIKVRSKNTAMRSNHWNTRGFSWKMRPYSDQNRLYRWVTEHFSQWQIKIKDNNTAMRSHHWNTRGFLWKNEALPWLDRSCADESQSISTNDKSGSKAITNNHEKLPLEHKIFLKKGMSHKPLWPIRKWASKKITLCTNHSEVTNDS